MWLHQYLVHIFPGVSVLVIFQTTDLKIKAGHAKIFPFIAIVFSVVNCYHVKKTGEPTYWFLTWEDHTSPLVILTLLSICNAWFVGLAKLTETLKCSTKSVQPTCKEIEVSCMNECNRCMSLNSANSTDAWMQSA